jgi:N-methylhydantoinase B
MSYSCDRARSITWGINGGLPSFPHGVWLRRGNEEEEFLGAAFSNVPVHTDDVFWRPSAGGGGFGDPLERDPERVKEDVVDGYVSLGRARLDYGVVLRELDRELSEYELDREATEHERAQIRANRVKWLEEDPEEIASRYRAGELDMFDLVRRYGVILDWGPGKLLPMTTKMFRAMLRKRMVSRWDGGGEASSLNAERVAPAQAVR